MKHLAALLLALSAAAHAQPYAGIAVGIGGNGTSTADRYNTGTMANTQDVHNSTVGAFAGYTFSGWSAEGGLTALPSYRGTAATSCYTCYRPGPGNPTTAAIAQTIDPMAL